MQERRRRLRLRDNGQPRADEHLLRCFSDIGHAWIRNKDRRRDRERGPCRGHRNQTCSVRTPGGWRSDKGSAGAEVHILVDVRAVLIDQFEKTFRVLTCNRRPVREEPIRVSYKKHQRSWNGSRNVLARA